MRRSRLGQSKGLLNKIVFVLIALAFVGSGYLIGRYFLSSLLDRPAGRTGYRWRAYKAWR